MNHYLFIDSDLKCKAVHMIVNSLFQLICCMHVLCRLSFWSHNVATSVSLWRWYPTSRESSKSRKHLYTFSRSRPCITLWGNTLHWLQFSLLNAFCIFFTRLFSTALCYCCYIIWHLLHDGILLLSGVLIFSKSVTNYQYQYLLKKYQQYQY